MAKGLIEFIIINRIVNNSDILMSLLFQPILKSLIISILIFSAFLLLRKIFAHYVFAWILKLCHKSESEWDDKLILAVEKPLQVIIVITGLYFALSILPLGPALDIFISRVFRSALIGIIGWSLYNLSSSTSLLTQELQQKFMIDNILIPFFSKALRFIIIAMALIVIAQEWNYDVNGFIAGLGLGGLAFALAAKDMLSNMFGGFVIIMEKPFQIGDWITTSSVEGIVESISFRSTKVRTFEHSLVTVPNSTLAGEPITNNTRAGKRRIRFYLGVTYGTTAQSLRTCTQQIKQMLIEHPGVQTETIIVNFETFNDSSLDILIYCFTNAIKLAEHLAVKEDINLKIMQILEREGISVAFPSRSIYLENYHQDKK